MPSFTTNQFRPSVVVYGGYGFFGRLVVEDILGHTSARVIVAGRRPPRKQPWGNRVTAVASDLRDLDSVKATLCGARIVVHCAGPFQELPLNPLRAAIERGVDYVDLAEDREFVRRVHGFDADARRAGVAVLSGLSVVPGMSVLMTQALRADFDAIDAVRTFIAPGTRGSRGSATFWSLLSGAGRPFLLPRAGREVFVRGWSEPEWIEFPPPVGRRLQYLAIPVADFDLMPHYFSARSVEFRAGSESALLSRALSLAARCRYLTGGPRLEWWAHRLRRLMRVVGQFGTDRGGVLVEVHGTRVRKPRTEQIAVVARREGHRIPAVLAGVGVAALLHGEVASRGAVPLDSWITARRLIDELSRRGLNVWRKPSATLRWEPLDASAIPGNER